MNYGEKTLGFRVFTFLVCLLIGAVIGLSPSYLFTSEALAQKQRAVGAGAIDIDSTVAPLTGKRVTYQLTDEEGGLLLDALGQGRKVPALITYNYRTRRNADGMLVSPLTIFRPAVAGGLLLKDEVPGDSARSPGTWDTYQPGDLRN